MNEIRAKYLLKADGKNPRPLRWLIIADDGGRMFNELSFLRNHLKSSGKPADVILVSREIEVPEERLKTIDIDGIYRIDDTVSPQERESLIRYLQRHKVLDEELARRNLQDKEINSSLFALMYSCVRQSNENIKNLLKDEYDKLDPGLKKVYGFVSLVQAYRVQPLVSLLSRGGSVDYDWLENQAVKGALSGVVKYTDFRSSLVTSNRLIAERYVK